MKGLEDILPPSKTKTEFTNDGKAPLEIWVEPYPDRYILQPGDRLALVAELGSDSGGKPSFFTFNVSEGGLQIFAGWDAEPLAYINGIFTQPL